MEISHWISLHLEETIKEEMEWEFQIHLEHLLILSFLLPLLSHPHLIGKVRLIIIMLVLELVVVVGEVVEE